MISELAVREWSATHPWPLPSQVEQDLLLSRAICEIATHPCLGRELVFRGGTALHKLHLPGPLRYSEDLDYVRTTAGGIGPLVTALGELGRELGFTTSSVLRLHPKVVWKTTTDDDLPLKIKIEVNTHERSPALALARLPFQVGSSWWRGSAEVTTFQPAELVATKIRALYQRSKGRDLFDLWLALTTLNLDPHIVCADGFRALPSRRADPSARHRQPAGQAREPSIPERHLAAHSLPTGRLRYRPSCRPGDRPAAEPPQHLNRDPLTGAVPRCERA
ncbi:MAG: nucleotidyl transferase AbiEii/AbiGii toxin family protein [Bifidobacteriaceae bacterium]|jgi:hypothetical protein|nr:nucleotidyl transferase AbiEii/AbiGii toxin family protein [Bifidobacteriaceae bacterium]